MSPFSAETPAVAKSCRGFCRLRCRVDEQESKHRVCDPPYAMRGLDNLRTTVTPPHRAPRYTRPHGYQNTQHSNARRERANDAVRLRSRARCGPLCPVALGPHALGQRVQLPVCVAFGPQPGRQHRVAHRGPGRSLQAPRACRPTNRRPGMARARVGRRPLLPARSSGPVRERPAPAARRRPHLPLLLHARRTPRRERAARQRRHAHLSWRLPRAFGRRGRPPQCPARPGHAPARARRRRPRRRCGRICGPHVWCPMRGARHRMRRLFGASQRRRVCLPVSRGGR